MINSLTAVVTPSAALQLTETVHGNDGSYAAFDGQAMANYGGWRAPNYKTSHVADALQDLDEPLLTAAITSATGINISTSVGIQKAQAMCKVVYNSSNVKSHLCSVRGNVYRKGTHSMGAHKDSIILRHTVELEADDDHFQVVKATDYTKRCCSYAMTAEEDRAVPDLVVGPGEVGMSAVDLSRQG